MIDKVWDVNLIKIPYLTVMLLYNLLLKKKKHTWIMEVNKKKKSP